MAAQGKSHASHLRHFQFQTPAGDCFILSDLRSARGLDGGCVCTAAFLPNLPSQQSVNPHKLAPDLVSLTYGHSAGTLPAVQKAGLALFPTFPPSTAS